MTTTYFNPTTLRIGAWPSCHSQVGMPLVAKDRRLSGTTTE